MIINSNNINEILNTDKLVVLECGAEWCGPCKAIKPILDDIEKTYNGIIVGTCDVDESPEIPEKFNIRNVPTILFIKNNEVLDRTVGAQPKQTILDKINILK